MQIGISIGIPGGARGNGAAPIYPIDDVGGVAPVAAYGTKKLRSAYTGYALRVVRPSDSATLDVGFVGQNLDTTSLISFLGGQFGKVDIWYDQIGSNNATQVTDASRPTIAGNSYGGATSLFHVDGNMSIPVGVATNRSTLDTFTVHEAISSNIQSTILQVGTGANQISCYTTTGAGLSAFNGNPGVAASSFSPQTRPIIVELSSSLTSASISQAAETKTTAGGSAPTAMTGGNIGTTSLSGGFTNNRTYAHIIYNRNVTAGERTTMRASLNLLYGITEAPSNRLVFEGDSITIGSSPSSIKYNGYARQSLALLSKSAHVYNVASGGTQIQNELGATYAAQAGAILGAYAGNRIVFLMMGTNDLTIGGRSAAQIYADIQTYAGLVRGSGGKIIVGTILPNAAWSAGQQTIRTTLNASIVSGWSGFADGLCDFAADATMGPQAAASNASLYPDGLHPSELGHSYLAPLAAAAINALLV